MLERPFTNEGIRDDSQNGFQQEESLVQRDSGGLNHKRTYSSFLKPKSEVDYTELFFKEIARYKLFTLEEERSESAKIFLGKLAYSTLVILADKKSLPKVHKSQISKQLDNKAKQRLGVLFEKSLKPGNRPKLYTSRKAWEEEIKKSEKPVNREQVFVGYARWIDSRLNSALRREKGRKGNGFARAIINEQIELIDEAVWAAEKMEIHNLRLVVFVAKRFLGKGMELMDLVQEGRFGLARAIDKFDFLLGNKNSTYATWWIDQKISRAVYDKANAMRLPVNINRLLSKIARIEAKMKSEMDHLPSENEIFKRVKNELRINDEFKFELFCRIRQAKNIVSLDKPLSKEGNNEKAASLLNFQHVEDISDEDKVLQESMRSEVNELLNCLNDKQRTVICLRFGIGSNQEGMTLSQIGSKLTLTRERIRQIEATAFKKLKQHPKIKELAHYLQ